MATHTADWMDIPNASNVYSIEHDEMIIKKGQIDSLLIFLQAEIQRYRGEAVIYHSAENKRAIKTLHLILEHLTAIKTTATQL